MGAVAAGLAVGMLVAGFTVPALGDFSVAAVAVLLILAVLWDVLRARILGVA